MGDNMFISFKLWRASHRWNRNPRPQPQNFSKLAFLIESS